MLTVKTSLKEFKGKGMGLVSGEFIKKGKIVWRFSPIIDLVINPEDVPIELKEFIETYAVKDKGKWFLLGDNARFINHSKKPNVKSLGNFEENIAVRDIKIGEEMTIDYEEIDEEPINFENIEEKNKKGLNKLP